MAHGTVPMAQIRRHALAALGISPVEQLAPLVPQPATCLLTTSTTRHSMLTEQMRGDAGFASPVTSGVGIRSMCMRCVCVTDSWTVLTAVISGTALTPLPEKPSQQQSLAA